MVIFIYKYLIMGKVYRFNENEIKDIIKMYVEDFESTNNVAKKYKVDSSVISKRLIDNNIILAKGSAYSEQYWLDRGMDKTDIKNHIKTLRPVNKEYWLKLGYTEEESILQIEGQKLVSERGCVARYGKIEGKRIWKEREDKRSKNGKKGSTSLEYWINKGYSEKEAKIKRSERQKTFSKKKCIEKYGKKEGLIIFTERQCKWQKTLYKNGKLKSGYSGISQELFFEIIKYVDDTKLLNQIFFAEKGGDGYSGISQELFFEIIKYVDDTKLLNQIFFAEKGGEYVMDSEYGFYRFDYVDTKNKKIVEYNGDQYHGNPNKYIAEDTPHPFRKDITAQEMWDNDKRKIDLAKENGFDVLIIWDSEYRLGNKQDIINKCIKFLNYNK